MENEQELLASTERQIIEYHKHVDEQAAKVAELSAKGPPPEDAVDVLRQLKDMLHTAEALRDHLLRKLRGA